MQLTRWRLPAIFCALVLPMCALIVHPVLEMGMIDDFSYTKSAQILAQTGHIAYVGWAAAIIGWQLVLGALFIKLFGFSFTVVRASTLLVAMVTAFLTQRAFVRSGLNEWNATLGTLTLMLCPMTLALTFSYMTDIGGLFCFILCFYACLRAVQSISVPATLGWIVFAAFSNAIGGTVRQVAWLGVLVMVPCTCWLLRKRPYVVLAGAVSWTLSCIFIFLAMRWFQHQPYAQPNVTGIGHFDASMIARLVLVFGRSVAEMPLLLLPILILFVSELTRTRSRNFYACTFAALGLLGLLTSAPLRLRLHSGSWVLAPYLQSYITTHGLVDGRRLKGDRPIVLTFDIRLAVTAVLAVAITCFIANLLAYRRSHDRSGPIKWNAPAVLLLPFAAANLVALVPMAFRGVLFDRYLLSLFAIAILFLLLYYQRAIRPRLHPASLIFIGIFAAFGVAGTHDVFAMYRAIFGAAKELRASGVPATAIDAGFDYNGWTQLETSGYINSEQIVTPAGAYVLPPPRPASCPPQDEILVPSIMPAYALSYDPNACEGPSGYSPVPYHAWLGPHHVNIYIVREPPPQSAPVVP